MTNSIGILLETPSSSRRLRDNGTKLEEIPQEERYVHQVAGQRIAITEILKIAAQNRQAIRALTNASRNRAIQAGMTHDESAPVVLDYRLVSRGTEEVWMPDEAAPGGYRPQQVEVFLRYEPVRTTTRPLGYILPQSMAKVLPLLFDHDITVHRFTEPTSVEVEVYSATAVRDTEYFQGHYLKAVDVEKETETIEVPAGAYYISTAQSRGNLISYIFEPETDDNLITWGYADHLLQLADGEDGRSQRVPMMRVVTEQRLPVVEAVPFNGYSRNRYYQTW